MKLSLIVAVAENGVIGRDGGLPWHMSSDLKTFRRLTMGKPIVMGRNTFRSIGKPLDGRDNIVVTRDPFFERAGVSAAATLSDALMLARMLAATRGADEIMVIGGAKIYEHALPLADRIYFTRVHGSPAGDRHFATLDINEWAEVAREPIAQGPRDDYAATLITFERKGQTTN